MTFEGLAYVCGSTTGLAIFARALPWPEAWKAKKPLACPACMSGWSAFVALGTAHFAGVLPLESIWQAVGLWSTCIGVSAPIFNGIYPPHVEIELPGE